MAANLIFGGRLQANLVWATGLKSFLFRQEVMMDFFI